MYKVYRVTNDEKTPLVVANKNKEFIAEFWNPEAAAYVAKTMKLAIKDNIVPIEVGKYSNPFLVKIAEEPQPVAARSANIIAVIIVVP